MFFKGDKTIKIELPSDVKTILNMLNEFGYEAFVVGGCVRDSLLGRKAHDWDITTNATPDEIENVFKALHTLDVGKKYGTVIVMVNDIPYEITTYRTDGNYSDNRRPTNVKFVSDLKSDLQRRDFTINAMAYHPDNGLIDIFHGREAIKQKQIKCIGNPDDRFEEDGLRILRAIRFATQLEFKIEHFTSKAIRNNKDLLNNISKERIQVELTKILASKDCGVSILREYEDIISYIIPQIHPMVGFAQNNPHHIYDVWEHTLHCMIDIADNADMITRLAVFFHDIGKPYCYTESDGIGHFYGHAPKSASITKEILTNLKFSNDVIDSVTELVKLHDYTFVPTKSCVKNLLNKVGEKQARRLLVVRTCDIHGQADISSLSKIDELIKIKQLLDYIIEEKECFSLKDLAINGKDLIDMGVPEGKQIGNILNMCLEWVMDGSVKNEKESIIEVLEAFNFGNK